MATVDLDALEEEIASFGTVMTSDVDGDWLDVELEVTKFRVHRDGFICENDGTDMTGIILSLARAVSPSAPDGVRGDAWTRVRKIISRYEDGSTESMAIADGVASAAVDAVLAVLPPAPRVDVDAVMRLIETYGGACESIGLVNGQEVERVKSVALQHLAAIRAILEPHDAARLRETAAKAAFDSQRKSRGEEYGSVDWDQISGRHREGWLDIADAVIRAIGGER